MKKKLLVSATIAVVAALVFTACEGPAGPRGPAGPAGSPNVQTVLFAYLGSLQSIPSGLSNSTIVVFDTVDVDELNGYDPSTGIYTVQADGDYTVAFTIDWADVFTDEDEIRYDVDLNSVAFVSVDLTSGGGREGYSLSTSIPNLSAGETIEVRVRHDNFFSKSILGTSRPETQLAIDRLE